jgi:hypothetical protein
MSWNVPWSKNIGLLGCRRPLPDRWRVGATQPLSDLAPVMPPLPAGGCGGMAVGWHPPHPQCVSRLPVDRTPRPRSVRHAARVCTSRSRPDSAAVIIGTCCASRLSAAFAPVSSCSPAAFLAAAAPAAQAPRPQAPVRAALGLRLACCLQRWPAASAAGGGLPVARRNTGGGRGGAGGGATGKVALYFLYSRHQTHVDTSKGGPPGHG